MLWASGAKEASQACARLGLRCVALSANQLDKMVDRWHLTECGDNHQCSISCTCLRQQKGKKRAQQSRPGKKREGRTGQSRAGQDSFQWGGGTQRGNQKGKSSTSAVVLSQHGTAESHASAAPHFVTVLIHPAFIFSRETCTVTVLEWCLWALYPLRRICAISLSPCCIAAACWGVRGGSPMPG